LIKIPKRQLFKDYFLLFSIFLVCLPIFSIYFLKFNPKLSFLYYLSLFFLVLILCYLIAEENRRERLIFLQKQDTQERVNLITASMNEEKKALAALEKKIASYSSLKGVTEELTKSLTLEETANTLSFLTCEIIGEHDKVCILYLFEATTGELGIIATNKGKERDTIKSKKGDIFDGWVIKKLQPLLVEDVKRDFRFDLERVEAEELRPIRSLISVPLIVGKQFLGILRVDSEKEFSFTNDDLRLLSTLADLGAIAIENALLYQKAKELSIRDGLTGFYLRRYLNERLEEEIKRSLRKGSAFSVLMVDIDKFKDYNDKFGHMAGDIVLKTISKMLYMHFDQPGNILSRYGGEEFLVVLTECHKDKAQLLAENLRKAVKEKEITLRKRHTHVAVSIGIASFPEDSKVMEDLIRCADSALYTAKKSGRDKVCIWQ